MAVKPLMLLFDYTQFVERLKQMTPDDEWHTAIHEAGHAVVAWYLHPAFSVSKVSIWSPTCRVSTFDHEHPLAYRLP
jgi:ATP-dependent Zn protease